MENDKRRWKCVQVPSAVLRVFADVETGDLAIAMTDERYAPDVRVGGEWWPEDSPAGIRWIDPTRPISVYASDSAFLPVVLDHFRACKLGTGVLIPTVEVFALAEQFGLAVQTKMIKGSRTYHVQKLGSSDQIPYWVEYRDSKNLVVVRRRADDARRFVYLETDLVAVEPGGDVAMRLARLLQGRAEEIRATWRRERRSSARNVPALMRLVAELHEEAKWEMAAVGARE